MKSRLKLSSTDLSRKMPTPRKPEFKDFADFNTKLQEEQWKEYIWTQIQFIQKERFRLREKSKKQRDKQKGQGVKVESTPGASA